tara:strand:- start:311 stop:487 length:177 start_codon:yes stop_codon:yes gene_type:complete
MCGLVETPLGVETRCRGSYVWACYMVGVSVIIYNVLSPILRKNKLLKQEARRRLSETL